MIGRLIQARIVKAGFRTGLLCGLVFLAYSIFPQSQTNGRILGVVKDQTGQLITGAVVTIKNSATGKERTSATDNQGAYSVPLLAPGSYVVRITAPGFAPASILSGMRTLSSTA